MLCYVSLAYVFFSANDPFSAALVFQIGYNLDIPLAVLETTESTEPIADVYFKKALDLNPKSGMFWQMYGNHLAQSQKSDQAVWAYERALEVGDPSAFLSLATLYRSRGDREKSLSFLEQYGQVDEESYAHAATLRPTFFDGFLAIK